MKMRPTDNSNVYHRLHPDGARGNAPIRLPGTDVALDPAFLADNGVFGFEPADLRSRSFALLRSQLFNRFYREGGRMLAITSAQPGNGKTFITANIAASMSRIHPTVLVDFDLRRPMLAQRFGLSLDRGVDDYLSGEATLTQTGTWIAASELLIHGGRQPREDSATLLAGDRTEAMMNAIRDRADAPICIIDTPPIMVLNDIMLIARNVDGILLVVEEGDTRGTDVAEALRIIAPTPIIGTVLNKSLATERLRSSYKDYYHRT